MAETVDPPTFDGFPPATFGWLDGLAADNSRQYFALHRQTYDHVVRGALEAMLEELADEFGGRVKLFRQHRDVRFSADKSPYKTRAYGVILDRPASHAALYAELSPGGLFAGTGYHMLAADQLSRFREAVADEAAGPELERSIAGANEEGVEIFGEALKTSPRGYSRVHPRVQLLRHRSLVAGRRLDPGPDGIGRDAALRHTRGTWSACAPINAWLDTNVAASELPPR